MTARASGPAFAQAAFLWACGLDVAVRKPGNVSRESAGHAMLAEMFLASAQAAAGPLCTPGAPVGERIEGAVAATRAAVGCNTNLGILLLCAPLAAAFERRPESGDPAPLLAALPAVLDQLDVADARAAYRGIALANPGGLGRADREDVAAPPSIDLRRAMALAASRDSIARQYANGFADIERCGFATLNELSPQTTLAGAVQRLFLSYLSGWPDSHIVRKLGAAAAQSVTADAALWLARLRSDPAAAGSAAFAAWDEGLKAKGINPGTSADLTVCTLFAAALTRPQLLVMRPQEMWHGLCINPFRHRTFSDAGQEGLPAREAPVKSQRSA